jgi:hypothetical protein
MKMASLRFLGSQVPWTKSRWLRSQTCALYAHEHRQIENRMAIKLKALIGGGNKFAIDS